MSRIAFLSCHLTGTGHFVRTLAFARAVQARGHDVIMLTGGRPLPHMDTGDVEVVQLPPVTVRAFEFTVLREPDGKLVREKYMASRVAKISRVLEDFRPDAFITELFPFGRRVLAQEILAAIDAARQSNPKVSIMCSVRDVPEPKPKRLSETAARLLKNYHAVLVHGDEGFLPLWTTWPLPDDVAPMIHHVGYLLPPEVPPAPRRDDIIVAVGGGVLGREMLDKAAAAAALSRRPWHLLVGGADAEAAAEQLKSGHDSANLTIEPTRSDYGQLLASAGCSISLCGYNTALDLATCRTPAILVPSEEAEETEQLVRAQRLGMYPGLTCLRTAEATPELLAETADRMASGPLRPALPLWGDDGTHAAEQIEVTLVERA
ncbi:MAG: glycosyltransferase family protein [Paracoccaceae bacterium]